MNENPAYTVVTLNCSACERRTACLYAAEAGGPPPRCPWCGVDTYDYVREHPAAVVSSRALLEYLHTTAPDVVR